MPAQLKLNNNFIFMHSSIDTSLRAASPRRGLNDNAHLGDLSPTAKGVIIGAAVLGLGIGGLIAYTIYEIFHICFKDPAKKNEQLEMRGQAAVAEIKENKNGERKISFLMSTGERIKYVEKKDVIQNQNRVHQSPNSDGNRRAVYLVQDGEERIIEYFKYECDKENYWKDRKLLKEKGLNEKEADKHKSTFQSLEEFQEFSRIDVVKNKGLLESFCFNCDVISRKIKLLINLSQHTGCIIEKKDLEEMQALYDLTPEDIEASFKNLSAHKSYASSYFDDVEKEYDARVKKYKEGKYKDKPDGWAETKCKDEMCFYKLDRRCSSLNVDGVQFLDQAILHRTQRTKVAIEPVETIKEQINEVKPLLLDMRNKTPLNEREAFSLPFNQDILFSKMRFFHFLKQSSNFVFSEQGLHVLKNFSPSTKDTKRSVESLTEKTCSDDVERASLSMINTGTHIG